MAEEEKKALSFSIEDNKMKLSFDPNKDGEPVVNLVVDLAEVPDEIVDAVKK